MHELHLLHGPNWRLTAVAALLAVAVAVVVLLGSSRIDAGGGTPALPAASGPAPSQMAKTPAWVRDPLAPPTLELTAR